MYDRDRAAEELLEQIRRQENKRGKLKIFFGYAAGVGKTYTMLKAAHSAKNAGVDVAVGYVERHARPDTLALLEGLEQIPVKQVEYKGVSLGEFDIDRALKRKPRLIIVDELAHTNAPSCRHTKRYQDIDELLGAGIDVYTTVNVQHLESLHDIVASLTGISVSERIPDHVFDNADRVELVDIEPRDLIDRLKNGQVYKKEQAHRALGNFFAKGNLAALREIAMRRTADRLNKTARKESKDSAPKVAEHILICLSSAPSNAKVIRTAARMAKAFHGSFTALFVGTSDTKELQGDNLKRLRANLKLAQSLGAQIATAYGDEPAVQIAEYARVSGVTKIILGRTNHRTSKLWKTKNLTDRLVDLADNVDIYIIPDRHPLYKKKYRFKNIYARQFNFSDFAKTCAMAAAATLLGYIAFTAGLSEANIVMIYIMAVLLTSVMIPGEIYGIISAGIGVLCFNFFFTDPRFTFAATPKYIVTFLIMLATGVISSTLATQVKKQAVQAAQKAYYTELLMNSSRKMRRGADGDDILRICADQLTALLARPVIYAPVHPGQDTVYRVRGEQDALAQMTAEEKGVAEWVKKNNKHAGAGTDTLARAQNYYLAVRGARQVMGVIGVPVKKYPELDVFEKNLLISVVNERGIIMERSRLRRENRQIELETKQQKLRANFLRAISHDFRTPLASISGNAGVLMEQSGALSEDKKQELYRSIYDDTMWLVNLTENILSITKVEDGNMKLNLMPELIEEVFSEALKRADRKIKNYHVTCRVEGDFLMARMDVSLIIQVVVNILNNAVKYTPEGSKISLRAAKSGREVVITIADNGPGISDEDKKHLFDMFYTVQKGKACERRGLGLGLNLCRSIISAHGGQISVQDNNPKGSKFVFTLPLEEVNIENV